MLRTAGRGRRDYREGCVQRREGVVACIATALRQCGDGVGAALQQRWGGVGAAWDWREGFVGAE